MKHLILSLMFTLPLLASGQQNLSEVDLIGTWRMGLDMEKAIRSENKSTDLPARALVNGLAALLGTFTEEIDAHFRFLPDGKLRIITKENNKEKTEETTYRIAKGRVIIGQSGKDDGKYSNTWAMQGKRLQPLNDDGTVNRWVWLERK